jgi:hypothetical protein
MTLTWILLAACAAIAFVYVKKRRQRKASMANS